MSRRPKAVGARPGGAAMVALDPPAGSGITAATGYRTASAPAPPATVHRGLPSARLTFIVSLDEGVVSSFDPHVDLGAAAPDGVLLAGLHTTASRVRHDPGQRGVQLAVHPLAARALFGVPAAALLDGALDAGRVLGAAARRLHEQVAGALAADAVALLRGTLRPRDDVAPVRPEVRHAWSLLEGSVGRLPVHGIARTVGLSERHLSALLRAETGHGPKTLALLVRFEHVCRVLRAAAAAGRTGDLADVAVRSGYADQSHLSRDFVRFAGTSPGRWLAEEFRSVQDGGAPGAAGSTA